MPNTVDSQTNRREAIRQLLLDGPAANQKRLVDALITQGFVATQSSVSRDLREIGAIKTNVGYELLAANSDTVTTEKMVGVTDLVKNVDAAGPHLLVIKTAIGAAQRVALELDRSGWPDMVGTVAGDDTIFVATSGGAGQRRILSMMSRHGGHK